MSKIFKSSDKNYFVDKFFLSYYDEAVWLNKMAEDGYHLIKKSFYRYYFKRDNELDLKYTVELLNYPANSSIMAEYIEEKNNKGIDLVAYYKCRAYFAMNSEAFEEESAVSKKSRKKSVGMMFASYLIAFITSVVMLCYHCVSSLNFTVEASAEKMSALKDEFSFFEIFEKLADLIKLDKLLGDYQSTPVALMFFIAAVVFSVPVAIYFRELFLSETSKAKVKGKK